MKGVRGLIGRASAGAIPRLSKRLSLGTGLGLLAILITLVTAVAVIGRSQRAIERDLVRIVRVEEPTSAAAYEMEINSLEAGMAVLKYVQEGDPAQLRRVAEDNADFERHRLEFERLASTQRGRDLAVDIAVLHRRYREVGESLIEMRDEPPRDRREAFEEFARLREELDALLDEGIQARTRSDLLEALQDAEDNLFHLRGVNLAMIGAAGLVSIVAGGFVYVLSVSLRDASADELRLVIQRLRTSEARRSALLGRLVSAQEGERARIARELHDELGQGLTALSLGLANLGRATEGDASASAPRVRQLQELTQELSDEVRAIAWRLRPTLLDELGLEDGLANLVETWSERSGVPVDLFCDLGGRRLPSATETTLYRLVQEALTNIARHAQARSVNVVLHVSDLVRVVVEDDGDGFDVEAALEHGASQGCLGLVGIQERIEHAGGQLEIESSAGRGTSLVARLPLDQADEELPT